MPPRSAGLLVYRTTEEIEVLLVHPGGPIWAKKDAGAWSIPKGEFDGAQDPLTAAEREFNEELGRPAPPGPRLKLGDVVQAGGKRVTAWAVEGDIDVTRIVSNEFEMEWPPRSGVRRPFPEVDRAEWFDLRSARSKINQAQTQLLDRLVALLGDQTF